MSREFKSEFNKISKAKSFIDQFINFSKKYSGNVLAGTTYFERDDICHRRSFTM